MRLLVATGNRHKIEEFWRILAPLGIEILSLGDVGGNLDVEEEGESFLDNARVKARTYAKAAGMAAVADDSGLCVDALGGRPGVLSARYMGEETPYPRKIAALLDELRDVPAQRRGAHFACAICCVLEDGGEIACEGRCVGVIGEAPSGGGGFGYDPVFYVKGKSFAEIAPEEKDRISHRGRALRAFAGLLAERKKGKGMGI